MNIFLTFLNHYGDVAMEYLLPLSIQLSVVIACVWLIEWLLRRRVRASVRYALWMLVLIKLVLPPSLALPSGMGWWLRPEVEKSQSATVVVSQSAPQVNTPAASRPVVVQTDTVARTERVPDDVSVSLNAWLFLISLTGSLVLLSYLLFRWSEVGRICRNAQQPDAKWIELLREAALSAGLNASIHLKLTNRAMPPSVCGLFRPTVILPVKVIEQFEPRQIRAILLHECIHVRRMDGWINWFQTGVQILLWWHPLLWLTNSRIRDVREEAVDDAVAETLNEAPEFYAKTLLEVAVSVFDKPRIVLGLLGIMESKGTLGRRIQRLLTRPHPRMVGLTFVSVLAIVILAFLVLPLGPSSVVVPSGVVRNGSGITYMPAEIFSQPASPYTIPVQQTTNGINAIFTTNNSAIRFQIHFVELKADIISTLGTTNPLTHLTTIKTINSDMDSVSRSYLNIPDVVATRILRSSMPSSYVMNSSEHAGLIRWAETRSGTDVLTSPPLLITNGCTGDISVLGKITICTEIDTNAVFKSANKTNSQFYKTAIMECGPKVTLVPRMTSDGKIVVSVMAHVMEFMGYVPQGQSNIVTLKTESGKSIRVQAPQPLAMVRELRAESVLAPGESLLVGGVTNRATMTIKDKVPILGDLPLIKPMFRHQSTQTYPQLLFLVVTPEIVSGTNSVSQ